MHRSVATLSGGSLGADSSRGVALMMSGAGLSDLGASAAGEVAALGAEYPSGEGRLVRLSPSAILDS